MNFEDESYVRLYVRDTKTWLRLGFEGQCVLVFLLRKLDRAGVLDGIEDASPDVALITGVPLAIVHVGLPRLLERRVFEHHGDCLVMPNFIQAQTAIRTDKARQKDARDKRMAEARLVTIRESSVTPRDGADTQRDQTVTANDTAQQPVTPILSVPSFTAPSLVPPVVPPGDTAASPAKTPKARKPKWKRVPETWSGPNASHRSKTAHWPKGKLEREERRYRDWNFRASKTDPDATFHNWLDRAEEDLLSVANRTNGVRTSSRDDTMRFLADEHAAALAREALEAS